MTEQTMVELAQMLIEWMNDNNRQEPYPDSEDEYEVFLAAVLRYMRYCKAMHELEKLGAFD